MAVLQPTWKKDSNTDFWTQVILKKASAKSESNPDTKNMSVHLTIFNKIIKLKFQRDFQRSLNWMSRLNYHMLRCRVKNDAHIFLR